MSPGRLYGVRARGEVMSQQEVLDYMGHSKTILEWYERKEQVVQMNGGLPEQWDEWINDSGFFDGLRNSWDTQFRGALGNIG